MPRKARAWGRLRTTGLALALLASTAAPASAQWYVAGFAGANHTQPATVTIDQPSRDTHLDIAGVTFRSESMDSPQYYGYRVGWLHGDRTRWQWGLELEFVHPKVFGRTGRTVTFSGRIGGVAVSATAPMDTLVSRYAMSHGLNFALANLVLRFPLGAPGTGPSRFAVMARAGAGPTIPHAETTIQGESYDGYEVDGLGIHGAVGLEARLAGRLSGTLEYQCSYARPTITVVDGTGHTTATVHQLAVGLTIRLTR
jgi:hypothetical protein